MWAYAPTSIIVRLLAMMTVVSTLVVFTISSVLTNALGIKTTNINTLDISTYPPHYLTTISTASIFIVISVIITCLHMVYDKPEKVSEDNEETTRWYDNLKRNSNE